MIEFHAGAGPDSEAIGIALEEMFLDYRVMPGKAPVPVIAVGGARMPGAASIVLSLARRTDRFLPKPDTDAAKPWMAPAPPPLAEIDAALAGGGFLLGDYSIADMMVYPRIVALGAVDGHPNIARWAEVMRLRPAVGRGMVAIAR